ncbi:hypothetical protein DJ031_05185 [bacterium endosymbiont of Escarpia laminata]|nr:MAG: hypothetical protein DJ031_05185 [bacterium endosymbiont of Escarpia laminata]
MNSIIWILISATILVGCVNTPRHFKPAGFQTADQAKEYVPDYLYYANKLTDEEWDDFYQRFPEYWKDMQDAKVFGATMEFHPWYTAYSFKWNTNRRKEHWEHSTLTRLSNKQLRKSDNVFKIIYSLGVPGRVVWDNDFEILAYKPDIAIILSNGLYQSKKVCPGCFERYNITTEDGMYDKGVIDVLGLKRPEY